jgi:hypothetical protein
MSSRRAMADVWSVLLVVAFFAVCVALVGGCDRIIGGDEAADLGVPEVAEEESGEAEPVGVGR